MNDDDFPGDRPFPSETKKQTAVTAPQAQRMPAQAATLQLSETAEFIGMIERAARDPAVDVAKIKALLEIRNELETMRAKREFNVAMSAAQTAMRPIATDMVNKQTNSKYASYVALDQAIRSIYVAHGFGLSFDTGECPHENCVRVLCYVSNTSGFERTYHIDMPADGKGAKGGDVMTKTHATGSAITYGKRYLLGMIFNIAVGGDDDGNAAAETQKFITEKQADDLAALITEGGGSVAKFLEFIKCDALTNIYANKYEAAVKAVNQANTQRKAQKAKTKGAAK